MHELDLKETHKGADDWSANFSDIVTRFEDGMGVLKEEREEEEKEE